jgi:hypothetical protein
MRCTCLSKCSKGFDIIVTDDTAPEAGGTMIVCRNSLFCNGRKGMRELGFQTDNINCNTARDFFGPPGLVRCPN